MPPRLRTSEKRKLRSALPLAISSDQWNRYRGINMPTKQ